jgi:hypothetical protein
MTEGSFKTFNYVYEGLELEVTAEDLGGGRTSFTVKCLAGYADINALYWNDGVADATQFDLGTKKDNSLNMNGTGEDWDGGVKLSSTGLGKAALDGTTTTGLEKSTYLTAGESYTIEYDIDWATLDTLGVRATSTSTAEGSIKAVDNEITGQIGENLFTENFDGYAGTYFSDGGEVVFAQVNLNQANGWTGETVSSELGADGYGGIPNTSPDATPESDQDLFWLDTQNSPGPINISHEFTDETDAVGGITSKLSFDIATQWLNFAGNDYQTDPDASFAVLIDGDPVAEFSKLSHPDLFVSPNQMQHVSVDITEYAGAGNTHTLQLVDTTAGTNLYTGFAIDSIQINDWVI